MKKHITTAILVLSIIPLSCVGQGKMLDDGFSLKFSIGFPPAEYGFDGDIPVPEGFALETTFGMEIGNQWYFYKNEHFGVGLDINWFDFVYGKTKINDPLLVESADRFTFEASFIEFGPVVTYAINDLFAIEAYYNLRPTYMATWYREGPDDDVVVRNYSFLHAVGIGARLKFFYIGYESTFGTVNGNVTGYGEYEDITDLFDKQDMSGNNSKLIIGFAF